jgi:hypothetical protein
MQRQEVDHGCQGLGATAVLMTGMGFLSEVMDMSGITQVMAKQLLDTENVPING